MAETADDTRTSRAYFARGEKEYTLQDVIDWGWFHNELERAWSDFLLGHLAIKQAAAGQRELDERAVDEMAVAFRYDYDLITAEETERWMERRGVTLTEFSEYFARRYWKETLEDEIEASDEDYFSAEPNVRDLFVIELILSGEMERLATEFARRVAAPTKETESGVTPEETSAARSAFLEDHEFAEENAEEWLQQLKRDPAWLEEMLAIEASYRQRCSTLLTPQMRQRELGALRLPLTRFEVEMIELDSPDAAHEALLCVRDDGMSMQEVADEGRYPMRRADALLEDVPEDVQQKFLSVRPGDVLEPIPRGDGFQLCRILNKIDPTLDDEIVAQRVEEIILDRTFSELVDNRIDWRIRDAVSLE